MAIVYQNGVAGKICINPECGWKPLSEFHPNRLLGIPVGDGYKSRCRECANAQSRAEYAANLEKYRETQRKYVETNKEHYRELKRAHQKAHSEKYAETDRKWKEDHREEINTKAKERRQKDLEHYREIGRNSYERHAEERRKYSLEYYKLHPEKSVAASNRRRALKYASKVTHTEQEWQKLKARYNSTCLCCGKKEPEIKLTRDHVIPLTQGGSDSIDNVQPLCARCNSKKNNKHIDYR
ncbi:MAG: HNH endonuclease [Chloroflexi bacterium]|nr:HNH endonuclease [Chloroflexota bacterium]MBI3170399.1 HNH endonuclease [Chloroflexota bacterium]